MYQKTVLLLELTEWALPSPAYEVSAQVGSVLECLLGWALAGLVEEHHHFGSSGTLEADCYIAAGGSKYWNRYWAVCNSNLYTLTKPLFSIADPFDRCWCCVSLKILY